MPVGVAAAALHYGWPWVAPPGEWSHEHVLAFHPLARVWQFTVGMCTALVWERVDMRRRPGRLVGTVAEAGALALVAAAVTFEVPLGGWPHRQPWLGRPVNPRPVLGAAAVPPARQDGGAANAVLVWNKDESAVLPVAGGRTDAHGRLLLNTVGTPTAKPSSQVAAPVETARPAG